MSILFLVGFVAGVLGTLAVVFIAVGYVYDYLLSRDEETEDDASH